MPTSPIYKRFQPLNNPLWGSGGREFNSRRSDFSEMLWQKGLSLEGEGLRHHLTVNSNLLQRSTRFTLVQNFGDF
jgi:hypothetical protein